MYVLTKEAEISQFVAIWLQFVVQEEGVILLDHHHTTKELNVFDVMCTDVYALPIIYAMEAMGALDLDDEVDLFVLHCVYLARINKSLSDFTTAWNLHPLRTERNWSPKQIMINCLIQQAEIS